jgi:hypothetical protein
MPSLAELQIGSLELNSAHSCNLSAPVYASIHFNGTDPRDVGFDRLSRFLQANLPSPFNQSNAGDLCEWWIAQWNSKGDDVTSFLETEMEVCGYVNWHGNPDIAGIGVGPPLPPLSCGCEIVNRGLTDDHRIWNPVRPSFRVLAPGHDQRAP